MSTRGHYRMTMKTYRYRAVDVFTETRLEGNPLAVFPEASGLDDATVQRIANELNLAETAFAFPASQAGHDARVRIFTPRREMPFAGHPTIGTTFVLLDESLVTARQGGIVLQENIGPVAVVDGGEQPLIWLTTPPIRSGPLAVTVTRRAVAVTRRAVAVTRRVVAVTRRAVAATRRVVAGTRRAVAVTRRAAAATRRAVPIARALSLS